MMPPVHRKPIPGGALDGPRAITTCPTFCQIMRSLIWRKHQKLQMDPNLLSNSPQKIAQAMLAVFDFNRFTLFKTMCKLCSGYNFEA